MKKLFSKKEFSKKEFIKIFKKLEFQPFNDILLSKEYKDFYIYIVNSKIPMDDWEYNGSYLTKERADAKYDQVINSYGSVSESLPINVESDGRLLSSIEKSQYSILSGLRGDFCDIIKELLKETLDNKGLKKFNKVFNYTFSSIDQALETINTLDIDEIRTSREFEHLKNDVNTIREVYFPVYSDFEGVPTYKSWRYRSYSTTSTGHNPIQIRFFSEEIPMPIKSNVKEIQFTSIFTSIEDEIVSGKVRPYKLFIYYRKPVIPFHKIEEIVNLEFSTRKWVTLYDKKGVVAEKMLYSLYNGELSDLQGGGFVNINMDNGLPKERLFYIRSMGRREKPDARLFLAYSFDKWDNVIEVNQEYYELFYYSNDKVEVTNKASKVLVYDNKGNYIKTMENVLTTQEWELIAQNMTYILKGTSKSILDITYTDE